MRMWLFLPFVFAGCSSSTSGDSAACKPDGTYSAVYTKAAGTTCNVAEDLTPSAVTVTKDTVVLQGVTGGCPGTFDGCKFTGICEGRDTAGNITSTVQMSLAFDGSGFTDSIDLGLRPPAQPSSCALNYSVKASRK